MTVMRVFCLAAALALPAAVAQAATLSGETVTIEYIFGPNGDSVFSASGNGNFVVGPGVETDAFGVLSVDVDDKGLTISNIGGDSASFFGIAAFNGFRITDAFDAISRSFEDFMIVSSTFDNAGISATENALYVNLLAGPSSSSRLGDEITLAFGEPSVVPLPAGMLLLLSGLAGFAAARRRSNPVA